MIHIKDKNIRMQVSKVILDEVLEFKRFHLELPTSKHWIKELMDIKLIDDKLIKSLKDITTISISNGMHPQLNVYTYDCIRYFINETQDKFIFQLGDKIKETNTVMKQQKPIKATKQLNLFD
ncbi:MAG: hypothetical protein KAQ94_02635 [Arcobacteraceae bacterium]|nr:hypothetical protein [Arcobacteraceae bacterium]